MTREPNVIPLALYVHWPWCLRKCPYCDFNSHASPPDEAAYLDALIRDLEAALPWIWQRTILSVFIGGGTPSLMRGETVAALLAAIRARTRLAPAAEITLEANPGAADAQRFAAYREAGVNRLSLGVQSFDDAKLAALGRIHSAREAHEAIALAMRHFEHVNLDLMLALPGQTVAEACHDVAQAIASGAGHVSAYCLTIEPNTPFSRHPPPLPDEETTAEILEAAGERLCAAGFEHYEISAYARRGERCAHNLNYWRFGDYLGIGAGAHSKLTLPDGRIVREARARHPKDYLADPITRHWREVAVADLPGEFMLNALRLFEGVPLTLFSERTGLPPTAIAAPLAKARALGLLTEHADWLKPSSLGSRFLNRLVGLFLAETDVQTSAK
ncbi:MAG: radical SAM family heme chaperone HemW [Rhodocyclaceae bacterium]|nr:radical SAM family heme chaperone HemW [Rhodocyclaceae bacterium]